MSALANTVASRGQTCGVKWYVSRTQCPPHKHFRGFHLRQPFPGRTLLYIRTASPLNNFTLQECDPCTVRPLHKMKQSMVSVDRQGICCKSALLIQTLVDESMVIQRRKVSPRVTTHWSLTVQKTNYRKTCGQPLWPELEVPGATTSLENLGTKY